MENWPTIVLLGLIEGITEFLPVSSTGHLLLAERWLTRQSDLFNTVIQSGAVLAVLLVFTGRVRDLLFGWREPKNQAYLSKLALAFGITACGGLLLKKLHFKLPEDITPVAIATAVGGLLFVLVELWLRHRTQSDEITWRVAAAVGAGQLLAAVFPGTSRSGATILMGLVLGVSRPAAAEFSFLLGIPTLLAAGAVQTLAALKEPNLHEDWRMLALATSVAAITAFGVVRWLLKYVRHHSFVMFGWYRIVLGVTMLLLYR